MTTKEIQRIIKAKAAAPVVFRSYGFKEIEVNEAKVSGYLASFDTVDDYRDVLLKGCFTKSIQEHGPASSSYRKIAYLYQHDTSLPIGRFTKLSEDEFGLYFEADLDNIELAERVAEQYASGTLNQHSIGFRYIWDKMRYDEKEDVFLVGEVTLFEGSVVTIGANENTPFTGFKAAELVDMEAELLSKFEAIASKLSKGNPSDAYELRKVMSKFMALHKESQSAEKALDNLKKPLPVDIDYDKLTKLLTQPKN